MTSFPSRTLRKDDTRGEDVIKKRPRATSASCLEKENFQTSDCLPLASPGPAFLTTRSPSIELQLPGHMIPAEMETRRWYHWPLVLAGTWLGEALTQTLWTATDILSWRPLHIAGPECSVMRHLLCLEMLSPVPGHVAALVEHFQALTDAEAASWHDASLCLLEAEKRRNRHLTWLGLARSGTTLRLIALVAQVVYFVVFTAAHVLAPTLCNAFASQMEERTLCCYLELLEGVQEGLLLPWGSAFVPEGVCRMWGLQDCTEVRVLLQIIVADMIGDNASAANSSPISQGASKVVRQKIVSSSAPGSCTMRERLLEIPVPREKDMFSDTPHSWKSSPGDGKLVDASNLLDTVPEAGQCLPVGPSGSKRTSSMKREKTPERVLSVMDQLWGI